MKLFSDRIKWIANERFVSVCVRLVWSAAMWIVHGRRLVAHSDLMYSVYSERTRPVAEKVWPSEINLLLAPYTQLYDTVKSYSIHRTEILKC